MRSLKCTLWMLFLLWISPFLFAETLVSTDAVRDQGTILDILSNPFELQISGINSGEKIALKGEKESNGTMQTFFLWIPEGDCGIHLYTKFCYTSGSNSTGTWIATIQRYNLSPSVSLTAVASVSTLRVGEPFTVTFTLQNSGDFRAKNITLELIPDPHIEVETKDIFSQNSTHLFYYADSLVEGETTTFVPEFRVQRQGTQRIYYTLKFDDFYSLHPATISSFVEVNVTDYLNYSFTLTSSSLLVDAFTNFTAFIQNNITSTTVSVSSLKVEYPSFLTVVDLFRLSSPRSGVLSYKTTNLSYNGTKIPRATFLANAPGKGNIIVTMEYETSQSSTAQSRYRQEFPIVVGGKTPKLESSLPDTGYYIGGQELSVVISMTNPYQNAPLVVDQIIVILDNSIQQYPASIQVPPLTTKTLVNTTLRIPSVVTEKTSSLFVNVSYGGENFPKDSLAKNHSLSISKDTLEISLRVDPSELFSGEVAQVKVAIKNPTSRTFSSLHIYDISEMISTKNASVVLDLLPNQSLDVFSYEVVAPFVAEDTNLSHATLVEFEDGDRSRVYLNETIILVHPLSDDVEQQSPGNGLPSPEEGNSTTVLLQGEANEVTSTSLYGSPIFWIVLVIGICGIILSGFFTWKHFRDVEDVDEDVSVVDSSQSSLAQTTLGKTGFHPPLDEVRSAVTAAQRLPDEKATVDSAASNASSASPNQSSEIDSLLESMEHALEEKTTLFKK